MILRWFLYVVMAFGFAGFAAVAWVVVHQPPPPSLEAAAAPTVVVHPTVTILTAARPLNAGALLVPDDIATAQVEAPDPAGDAGVPVSRDALLGGMIRHAMPAGAPLRNDSVLRPGDRGFLAAVLEPGTRAVSVAVDQVSGAAGLIWPGDRVDVVLTQTVDSSTQPAAKRISGETMLTDLRVIAVDQQMMRGNVGTDGIERNVRTVTLQVTSAQAERIAVGARMGRLSLAVQASRPDKSAAPGARAPSVTWAGDVSGVFAPTRQDEPLRVYSGPEKLEEMHF